MASKQTRREIYITCNGKSADDMIQVLTGHLTDLNAKLNQLRANGQGETKEAKQLTSVIKQLSKQLKENVSDTQLIDRTIKNLAGSSTKQLRAALQAVRNEMGRVSEASGKLPQLRKQFEQLKAQIDKNTGAVHKQSSAWQTAMKNLTAYAGLFTMFNKAKELVTGAIRKNFEYSGSLTDIRKVSGLAMEDINQLSRELAKIDTRTSVDALAQLAYEGAKLGMGQYGVEGMAGFVRAADKINVAIGEEMGKEALPALSKLVETMGLIPKMGIEKAMDATGSAMFKLSASSTATSGNIVEFAKRLTGVARTAGITTDQLLALGSASDSMYLMPEVASTAMSKFIVALQRNHNLIEKDLGIQQGTIKNMYAAGNAMDAIVLVLEKMKQTGNMNALGGIFKDLGSDGQRLVTAMVTMSKNVDMLKDHLYESQEAFEEATAVTSEYEMQQKSAIGTLERANNLWEKAFVNPEGVDSVKSLADAWYNVSSMMTQSPIFKGSLKFALDALIFSAKTLAALLPVFISFAASQGIWSLLVFLNNLRKAIWAAVTAQTALNTACKVNPYVALASILITVAGAIYSFVSSASDAAKAEAEAERKANAWKNKLKEAQQQTDTLTQKLHSYKVALEQLNLSEKDRNTQIAKFNRDFRSYISKLGIEIKNVSDLKKHYAALSEEIQRATYYRMREEAKQDALPAYQKDRLNAANRVKQALATHGYARQLNSQTSVQDAADPGEDDVWTTKSIMSAFARSSNANDLYSQIITSRYPNAKNIKVDKKTGKYTYTDSKGKAVSNMGDIALLSSLRHYQNATKRELDKKKEIDDYFGPFVPEDYTPWVEDELGTLENDAPDKAALAEAKRQRQEQQRAWREELKQKQDEANAIMDNVRNFYERQINEKLSQAIASGMDKTEQDLFVEPVKRRMNEALQQVRLAIAGQKNSWEEFKATMDKDLIEQTDETGVNLSQGLLDDITSNNVEALRKKMEQLGNSLKRPMNSITAEIFAKATKNEQSNLKLEAQQMEARRKVAQENDYTGAVKQNMYDDFNTMGYANPTDTETADKAAFDARKKNIFDMYEKARTEIATLYTIDVSSTNGQGLLLQFLFGEDPDGMAARIKEVLKDNTADWQVFYNKLIQYSDDYAAAEKKVYDQQKKISDQMWAVNKRNLANQAQLRKIQEGSNLFGKRTNYLSNLGLKDLTADPEVELMKARMQAAEDYYAFIEKNYRNKQLLQEADTARQEAELAYANQMATSMKNRLSQMKELVQPIESFGEAVGSALADMKNDAESANEAIKSALKSMLESWGKMAINSVNTQMWKAINDAGAKRGKANAQPGIDAARANANADSSLTNAATIGTAGNPAHVIVDNGASLGGNIANDAPVGTTNNALGNATGGGSGTSATQDSEPPRAWQKRNAGGTIADYNAEVQAAAGQTGNAVADVATGNATLGEAGAGIAMSGMNAALNANLGGGSKNKKEDKERKKQVKEERKHQKDLTKEAKRGLKDREKETDKGIKNITDVTNEGNKEQSKGTQLANDAIVDGTQAALNTTLVAKQQNNSDTLKSDAARTQGEVTFSIAGAMAKCFEFLGPIAGPIAAAVVMTTLMGLLQWALSSALGSSSKSSSSSSSTNTKLKTGMLTYDSGNVQDLKPFVGDDGEMYWAEENNAPNSGVNLLSTPTATTINGQRSLVAENGPELVIGRETTKAMMMNNPSLLKALVNYDSNYSGRTAARRAFDKGNLSDLEMDGAMRSASQTGVQASATGTADATNAALLQAVSALITRLEQPITAQVNMFGRGQLYESLNKANQFMKGK